MLDGEVYDAVEAESLSYNGGPLLGYRVPYLFSGIRMLDGEVYDAVEAESLSYNGGLL